MGEVLVAVVRGEGPAPPHAATLTSAGLIGAMPGQASGLGLAAKLVTMTA
ncbi:hypothetical protein [Streptomyces rimosus]|nr:hypothetical protein [Streptomyces rimosus]